jgi:cyclic pyranopterin phosphate synthase
MKPTHLDAEGRARMVDVGDKPVSRRTATAEGRVTMSDEAFAAIRDATVVKGDVLTVAEIAGIGAAKEAGRLIPLCHPLSLDRVTVVAALVPEWPGVRIEATVSATGRTGVEMEALAAVAGACLTVYDMVKSLDRAMRIEAIRLRQKTGGVRGDWMSPEEEGLR